MDIDFFEQQLSIHVLCTIPTLRCPRMHPLNHMGIGKSSLIPNGSCSPIDFLVRISTRNFEKNQMICMNKIIYAVAIKFVPAQNISTFGTMLMFLLADCSQVSSSLVSINTRSIGLINGETVDASHWL